MNSNTSKLVAQLRQSAQAFAKSAGAPDRMTVADGQGGISTSAGTPKKDSGEDDLKRTQPTDGTTNPSTAPGGSPDRMTVADGQGGISTSAGTPKKDSGEDDLKRTQPTDAERNKSAADRVNALRATLHAANPTAFNAPQAKQAAHQPGADLIDISEATLLKLARAMVATDEGVAICSRHLAKQAGEQDYAAMLKQAAIDSQALDELDAIKQAAVEEGFAMASDIFDSLDQMGLTEADAADILKTASVHASAISELEDPMLKQAYAQGMDDAAAMEQGAEAGAEDPAIAGGGEDLSPEEAQQILQMLVSEGVISPEELDAALAEASGA